MAGNPSGQIPMAKSNANDHPKPAQQPPTLVTTYGVLPIACGSQTRNWAPSLLSWPFVQEILKLLHLFAKHAV